MSATVLEIDLTTPILEAPPPDPLAAVFARRRPLLRELVDAIRHATTDPEVAGLVAHIGTAGPTLSQVQELRDAIARFSAAGKRAIAWTETFGELGPATVPYYLATGFDEIWLQPSGDLCLTGITAEAVFVSEALGKLGVVPELSARGEYKSAVDTFLKTEMPEPHREAAGRLAASAMEQVVDGVATARELTPERVRELVDNAPMPAVEAKAAGLVDRLGYRDEVYTDLRRVLGDDVRLRYIHRYHRTRALQPRRALNRLAKRPVVALIHGTGDIHLGRTTRRGLGRSSIGSESLNSVLRAAAADTEVKAVVLRVDSPGGSYIASDTIRREVLRLRESGTPVVVSMGTVAASGGYFISMAADTIVADPGTLTGSIGVFGGKAVIRDLLGRLGVARDGVSEGRNAWMFSNYRRFTEAEWERLEGFLDRVYDDFTGKVAADRTMPRADVENVARGRVWTGADAHERGLVDELGGLERALDVACARAGVERTDAEVRTLPRLGFMERFRTPESSDDLPTAAAGLGPLVPPDGALGLLADTLGVPRLGLLTTPVLWRLG